ncbi:MAG TPA: alpha/beta hydrolase [Nocardioidaceae bacterium]|nr:alpha/beta hydrolase [Nocardioidaceae bacterium]
MSTAHDSGPSEPDDPRWFTDALAVPVDSGTVHVAGIDVSYRRWDGSGELGVLLVHGGAAHARWWDGVAPHLGAGPVVAIDLSGHGDSEWRSRYSATLWGVEVLGAAKALLPSRPTLVGHSMGGLVCLLAAREAGAALNGVIAIDSPINDHAAIPKSGPALERTTSRTEFDRDAMERRWRPMLDSGTMPPWMRRHVARHSIRATEGGFRWKFDPRFHLAGRIRNVIPSVPECPLVYVRPEFGLARDEMVEGMRLERGGERVRVVPLPGAGHNPMLDDSMALAGLLRDLLIDLGVTNEEVA